MIRVDELSFQYKNSEKRALDNISFSATTGVLGILGPNGAGKTTLLKILVALEQQQSGQFFLDQKEIKSPKSRDFLRAKLGYLPQNPHWNSRQKVSDFLEYFARLRGIKRNIPQKISSILELVDLDDKKNTFLSELSGGQKQRVFLSQAILHNPDFIVLDEPTASLDPIQRIEVRKAISKISKEKTIILATHLIEDLIHVANDLIILNRGKLIWSGTPENLKAEGIHGEKLGISQAEAGFIKVISSHEN